MNPRHREDSRVDGEGAQDDESFDRLIAPVARRIVLPAGAELAGDEAIYFPVDGIATLILQRDRIRFQIGFGKRGDAIGIQRLFEPAFPEVSAKVLRPGSFVCVGSQTLRRLLGADARLRERLWRYALRAASQYLEEAARAAALTLERRVAHWITRCGEALASDVIPITHHDLAYALGVRRSGVTVALHVLEGERLIRSRRARIEVIDGKGLAAFSRPQLS